MSPESCWTVLRCQIPCAQFTRNVEFPVSSPAGSGAPSLEGRNSFYPAFPSLQRGNCLTWRGSHLGAVEGGTGRGHPAVTPGTSLLAPQQHPAVTTGTTGTSLLLPQGHCCHLRDIPALTPGTSLLLGSCQVPPWRPRGDAGPQGCGHYQAGQCPCHLQLQDSPWCPGQELLLPAHPSSPWRMLPALPNAPNSWDSLPFLPEKVESNLIPPGTPKGGELLLFIGIPARFQRLEKSHGDAWCAPYPLISSNYRA